MEKINIFLNFMTKNKYYQSLNHLEDEEILNIMAGFYINGKNNTKILIVVDNQHRKFFADQLNKKLFNYDLKSFEENKKTDENE